VLKKESILIFVDGACSGNPGPGGWGAIVALPTDDVWELGGASPLTTNNRMELTAAIEAFKSIENQKGPVLICADSTYVIKGITQWLTGWKKRGWKTSAGESVANQEFWESLHALTSARTESVEWRYVKGHKGIAGNERADAIAVSYSTFAPQDLFRGPLKDYPVAIHDFSEGNAAESVFYLSLVDNVPMRHKTWGDCEKRVKGKSGAKYKKVKSALEGSEILKNWGVRD
jgi:ribonuclease HI